MADISKRPILVGIIGLVFGPFVDIVFCTYRAAVVYKIWLWLIKPAAIEHTVTFPAIIAGCLLISMFTLNFDGYKLNEDEKKLSRQLNSLIGPLITLIAGYLVYWWVR